MGCVTTEGLKDKRQHAHTEVSLVRGSAANDCELARKIDEKKEVGVLSKQIEEVNKQNKQLNKQITTLKKEFQIKKKESQDTIEQKEAQLKKLEQQKNREIEQLRKQLEREKSKSKQNQIHKDKTDSSKKQKDAPSIGLTSLEKNKSLCEECFYKLPRFTAVTPNLSECFNCRGYGLLLERFPYGANPSCDKSLCFTKGWDKVKCLKVCTICGGKGGQEIRTYIPRRF